MAEAQPVPGVVKAVARPLSILFFDVETSWNVFKGHGLRHEYVRWDQIVHPSFLHCWAAKFAGEKKMYSDRQTSKEALAKDETRIIRSLAALVRQADYVCAHNGDKFDIKQLRHRIARMEGEEPLGPVQSIDTVKMARAIGFPHSNLAALAREFGLPGKIKTTAELWDRCYEGDDIALQYMLRYCRNDVQELEAVFDRLKPHAVKLPRLVDGEGVFCPSCGGTSFQKRGASRTQAGTAQRYQCLACGRYFRDKTSDAGKSQMRPL